MQYKVGGFSVAPERDAALRDGVGASERERISWRVTPRKSDQLNPAAINNPSFTDFALGEGSSGSSSTAVHLRMDVWINDIGRWEQTKLST